MTPTTSFDPVLFKERENAVNSSPTPSAKVERRGNVTIITFTNGRARNVENVIAAELAGHTDGLGAGHLLLDFTHLERLSSLELGTLITLHRSRKASGGRLTLVNLNAEVSEIFAITHLDTILEIDREKPTPPSP